MTANDDILRAVKGLDKRVGNLEKQTLTNCKKLDTLQKDVSYIKKRLDGNKFTLK